MTCNVDWLDSSLAFKSCNFGGSPDQSLFDFVKNLVPQINCLIMDQIVELKISSKDRLKKKSYEMYFIYIKKTI